MLVLIRERIWLEFMNKDKDKDVGADQRAHIWLEFMDKDTDKDIGGDDESVHMVRIHE